MIRFMQELPGWLAGHPYAAVAIGFAVIALLVTAAQLTKKD